MICAIGRAACMQGTQVLYTRLPDFFKQVFSTQTIHRQKPFSHKCAEVPLLILDDWGFKKYSLEETNELSELLERRCGRAVTIISSQIPCTDWHDLFHDLTLADAIFDCIIHNAYVYNISGESMRRTI